MWRKTSGPTVSSPLERRWCTKQGHEFGWEEGAQVKHLIEAAAGDKCRLASLSALVVELSRPTSLSYATTRVVGLLKVFNLLRRNENDFICKNKVV